MVVEMKDIGARDPHNHLSVDNTRRSMLSAVRQMARSFRLYPRLYASMTILDEIEFRIAGRHAINQHLYGGCSALEAQS